MKPTCRQLLAFLDDYVAGELDAEHAEGFEWHLARCPSCVAYVASYRETIRAAHHASAPVGIEDVPADLLTAILSTVSRRK
jgi:anti-sigma factor RsiW